MAYLAQEESFMVPVNEHYDVVVREYVEQLHRLFPQISATDIFWSFYFFQATTIHVLIDAGYLEKQSGGLCRSSDFDITLDKTVRFFKAGFLGMARPD